MRDNQNRITGFSLPSASYTVNYGVNGHVTELQSSPPVSQAPALLTEANTSRAIALDSVTHRRDPFSVVTTYNFSMDQRTRIMLFATSVELAPGETASAITAQAEDSQQRIYPVAVEYVGKVPNFDWLTQVNVKLPGELINAGDIWVSIRVRGIPSKKALVTIKP